MLGFALSLPCSSLYGSLEDAVNRGPVVRKGHYARVDPGTWEVEPILDRTALVWTTAIEDSIGLYKNAARRLGLQLLAVMVRGSVPKGIAALDGSSDLDTFAYYRTDRAKHGERLFSLYMQNEGREAVRQLEHRHPLARRIEIRAHCITACSDVPQSFVASTLSVKVFGEWEPPCNRLPGCKGAVNIWADHDRALGCLSDDHSGECAQWFLKRCLRACMELCYREAGFYSRDLVPCYEALRAAHPEREELLLQALQVACGAKPEDALLRRIMHEMCTLTEDLFLEQLSFGREDGHKPMLCTERLRETSAREPRRHLQTWLSSLWHMFTREGDCTSYVEDPLPAVAVMPQFSVEEADGSTWMQSAPSSSRATVYRGGVAHWPALQKWTLPYLTRHLDDQVEVLVSPTNVFVYCNEASPWIAAGEFTPTSRRVLVKPNAFLHKVDAGRSTPPLYYGPDERWYMQARLPMQLLFRDAQVLMTSLTGEVAQSERVWVSTAGTVSSLHYDAADSFLVQIRGRKRVIFFPAKDVHGLDCYPIGHPLGRRSRVDLTNPSSGYGRHTAFWNGAVHRAQEVVLEAGDVLCFPSKWAHYTESLTFSISMTYRSCP
mmetsp:Transcript_1460/g.4392  ORF Transcript_1460/g.4392 Transcript_1460/m.4392 type:complete len:605 (+) Transcript_1460:34-1848(+)